MQFLQHGPTIILNNILDATLKLSRYKTEEATLTQQMSTLADQIREKQGQEEAEATLTQTMNTLADQIREKQEQEEAMDVTPEQPTQEKGEPLLKRPKIHIWHAPTCDTILD